MSRFTVEDEEYDEDALPAITPATAKIEPKPTGEEPELPEGIRKLAEKLARESMRNQQKVLNENVALRKVPGRLRALHRVYMPLVFDMWRTLADQLEPSDREFLQEWGFLSRREKKD